MQQKQEGIALVMAMMIVALIAVVAVEISWRFELNISRSGNRWHGMQAKAYLEGAEQLAMVVLSEDAKGEETSAVDHLGEAWAQEAEPFPTDHGWVKGTIEDAHGRLNINSLLPREDNNCPDGSQPPASGVCPETNECSKFTPAQQLFVRLLQTFNLGEEEEPVFLEKETARLIAEALIDWLDSDSEITGFGGAESDYYDQLEPPVSIANGPMISVSELQVIKGMTPELYRKLIPYVVALPATESNRLNINTISIPIIQTLTAAQPKESCDLFPMSAEVATEIAQVIKAGEFTSLDELKDDPALPSVWLSSDQNLNFDTSLVAMAQSTYFLFFAEAAVGEEHIRRSQSLIKRGGGGSSDERNDPAGDNGSSSGNPSGQPNQTQGQNRNGAQGDAIEIEVVRRTDANF
ncbi:type II secretion system minor pseudopilin GspK [Agarilytica rhodophyticola]|uniref:type II secretion system minor pseudopilin GspK n=1 Tax=Agarilytica rhodophyticola TaxID=1737490 RepID=UPI000B341679|nr:type II secretion system minor pseudopilin GspK [Agarilytica rhodophyticola]